jgi:hypothetical protein
VRSKLEWLSDLASDAPFVTEEEQYRPRWMYAAELSNPKRAPPFEFDQGAFDVFYRRGIREDQAL